MARQKERSKTLEQLKEDQDKARNDLQNLETTLVMTRGVFQYLAQEIKKLEESG